MEFKLFKNNMFQKSRIIMYLLVIVCYCGTIYATGNNNVNVTSENYIVESSEVNISNNANVSENSYSLREIAGYKNDEKLLKEVKDDEISKSMLNDLLHELKPYLIDLIDENVSDSYVFTTKDTINIVVFHPIKFLGALKDYVTNTLAETLSIAEENSKVVTE